ncbi:uncharacterized protein [Rutidosis leptorrhynchoides]|uniref:uncharacterized protein n=1 Tax=Rutidosis leptorrhynchoides TaxID=125765 RepID=UPI003A99C708
MPNYGNFLKDLIARKGEHEHASTTFLKAECDAIMKKREMPPKLDMTRSLSDSGACINLMPYTLHSLLNLGELKPATIGIRLIDRSVFRLVGSVENLVFKVGELVFLADFVVFDLEEYKVIPHALVIPFLATASAMIDVKAGKLTFKECGKHMSFQTRHTTNLPPTPIGSLNVVASVETT